MDPYRELGLSPEAASEPELIRAAFKALAKKYHPDAYPNPIEKARAEEKMKRLNEAQRLILSGEYRPSTHSSFELSISEQTTAPPPPPPSASRPSSPQPSRGKRLTAGPILVAILFLLAVVVTPTLFSDDHLATATLLEEKGSLEQALDSANRAVSENPRNGQAFLVRARLYKKLGYPDRAKVDLNNARSLLPLPQYEEALETLFPSPTPTPEASPSAPSDVP